jgi:hypothetical protein
VDFGAVRVDADLHAFEAQVGKLLRLRLANQDRIRLDLDLEHQPARVREGPCRAG